jgi:DNA-binding NtrC family response regulator
MSGGETMTAKQGRVLVIDDNEDILLAARVLLREHVAAVHTESDPTRIPQLLAKESHDVILLDMNFTRDVTSGADGFAWLERILDIDPEAVVVLVTAYGDVDTAVQAIKAGAIDFVLKPWQNDKLLATVTAAIRLRQSRQEVSSLRQRQRRMSEDMDRPFGEIVGTSPAMQRVYSVIERVAATDVNVLVLGENGTGKELVAREIHRRSARASEVFITVDLGSVPETLFESELFGHVRGAFTDARENRAGRFEVASGGTLFLDEIGNIPLSLQAKLLTVLENRIVVPLGSNAPVNIDIRLVAATNVPIQEKVESGQFRQDLFYRINTVELRLPPLRERRGDIALLADHFLRRYSQKYNSDVGEIDPAAMELMTRHRWPGNIRELQHVIERAVIMSRSSVLTAPDLTLTADAGVPNGMEMDDYNLERIERLAIEKALDKHDGNVSRAARELGLTRASLYRRMRRYGI